MFECWVIVVKWYSCQTVSLTMPLSIVHTMFIIVKGNQTSLSLGAIKT